MLGTLLDDRYRVESLLGEGGMGVVYRARDLTLERDVAIKVLRAEMLDDEARARLLREARSAAALNHPGIVAVYDAGESRGTPWVVMELVDGLDLSRLPALPLDELLDLARQLCDALGHAHALGIVHRDLKPENVLIRREGAVLHAKLADLGLAVSGTAQSLTQAGTLVGTASYLAPEQALGGSVDARADLYALGVMLYERAAGRLPFVGGDAITVISQHLYAPVVPPRTHRSDIPPALEAVILRLLAKQPQERYPDAASVAAALAEVNTNTPVEPTSAAGGDDARLLELLARGRLVGRSTELAQLREMWLRSLKGHGHLALVSGEPGSGKTRLVREVQVMARLHGADVLTGGGYEFEATTPYLPFVEALRRWVHEQPAEALRERLADSAPGLARLAPEIASKLGAFPPEPALAASEERLRLFDQFARFLRSLAGEHGVLLVLDDLHWADHGTLALLHYLLRQLGEERLLVIAAYRETELDRAHPLSAALVEWNRERLATRVALSRLPRAATGDLLSALFGQESTSAEFIDAIHRETDGNPFFVEEVVKSLIEHGQIYRGGGQWQRQAVADLSIPQSIKEAVGRRLNRLDPAHIEVLQCAAALGKKFDFGDLAVACTVNEDRLLDTLDAAVAAQLIRPEGSEAFAFTHDKIREVLHEESNPIRRRRLHLRIAESLERLHANALDGRVGDLAYHFSLGGDLKRGLDYSLRAATAAEAVYAHEEALGWYDRARECAEALEDVATLEQVHGSAGTVLFRWGRLPEAATHLERAIAIARDPVRRARLQSKLGSVYAMASDPRGPTVLAAALEHLDAASHPIERAMALAMVARYHHYALEYRQAIKVLEEARLLAEPLNDTEALESLLAFLAGSYWHMTRYDEGEAVCQALIDLGERKKSLLASAWGHGFMGEIKFARGDWQGALHHGRLDIECSRRMGSLSRRAWGLYIVAEGQLLHGEFEASVATARESQGLATQLGENRLEVLCCRSEAKAMLGLGRVDEAEALAEHTMALATTIGQPWISEIAAEARAEVHRHRGEWEQALATLKPTRKILLASDNRSIHVFSSRLFADVLRGCDRLDEAVAVAEETIAHCRAMVGPARVAETEIVLARIRREQGRLDEARALLDHAVEVFEASDIPYELGWALRERGSLRASVGDVVGAREDLTRAIERFDSCAAADDRAEAERMRSELAKA